MFMMISAEEAKNNVIEYVKSHSSESICKDINDKIVELSKEGKSYLWYNFSYMTDSNTIDSVVEYLKLYGYHVFKIGSYSIEIKW